MDENGYSTIFKAADQGEEVVNRQTPTVLGLRLRLIQAHHSRMLLPVLALLSTTAAFATAQLVFPNLDRDQLFKSLMDETHQNKPDSLPIDYDDFVRAPRLSDVMTLEPQASIFFSYARESAKFSGILSGEVENEDGKKYTVFVPMNRAVMALPRKPYVRPRVLQRVAGGGARLTVVVYRHEGHLQKVEIPVDITMKEADRESLLNVERWVGAHIVPVCLSIWPQVISLILIEIRSQEDLSDASSLTGSHATLLDKQTISLSHPEGKEGWKGVVLEPGKAAIIGRREVCTLHLVAELIN